MAGYTKRGLQLLAGLIELVQAENQWSDRRMGQESGLATSVFGDLKKAPLLYPHHKETSNSTLERLTAVLWIPFSDIQDPVTFYQLPRLGFTFAELRALCEGHIPLRLHQDDPVPPFTAAIEAKRAERKHGYAEMLEASNIAVSAESVERIRKLLLFGGWGENQAEVVGDVMYLGLFYLEDPEGIVRLQRESLCHDHENSHCGC